jgi:hypothetical protein
VNGYSITPVIGARTGMCVSFVGGDVGEGVGGVVVGYWVGYGVGYAVGYWYCSTPEPKNESNSFCVNSSLAWSSRPSFLALAPVDVSTASKMVDTTKLRGNVIISDNFF